MDPEKIVNYLSAHWRLVFLRKLWIERTDDKGKRWIEWEPTPPVMTFPYRISMVDHTKDIRKYDIYLNRKDWKNWRSLPIRTRYYKDLVL